MYKTLVSTEGLPYKDWLEYRRLGIGGSDASVVCGINRYKSPIELWMEKTGQFPSAEAGECAYWGQQLEALVKSEFTKRTGIMVTPINQILQSEAHSFMIANLDGVCNHPNYGPCVFEAKTASAYKNGEWENDTIPDEYMLQLAHYMAVTEYRAAYIAVLIGGNHFKYQFIERDDDLINMLIQLERDFWHQVQSNTPPPLDGSEASAKFLNERFPDSIPKSKVILPAEAASLIEQYNDLSGKIDHYTELRQEVENHIKQMLGEYEVGTVADKIVTWKSVHQERLDCSTLKNKHPKLYKKYINKTSCRRFSIRETTAM